MTKHARSASQTKSIASRLCQAVDGCDPRITRSQLAARLGVTAGAVSHYLNGNRACPRLIVGKIARITKTEPGWLLQGAQKAGKRSTVVNAAEARHSRKRLLTWGFREAPADGGKDFGNAAVYATPMSIRTVVREDGQNSLDAALRPEVTIRFRLVELSPGSKRYDRFVRAMRLDQLSERIRAIEDAAEFESKLGTKLSAGLEHVQQEKIVLLLIDDYGTRGLQGDEFDSTKPFCALVRDNLNSRKEAQTAGGVFGVGAKVNIACSRLSTVLYSSKVEGQESKGTRVIGRAELTYHELDGRRDRQRFAGPGWLGDVGVGSGVVESAWLDDEDPLLDDLMLRRDKLPRGVRGVDAAGTSILVAGFTDPQTESGASTQQLADAFAEAAAVSFWPAMMRGALTVWVERYIDDLEEPLKSEQVDPRAVAGVTELCDAWEKDQIGNTAPVLTSIGEVATVSIPFTVPATRLRARGVKPHEELTAECRLLVRLADPESVSGDPRVGQVAYVRGRAMVTRYQARGGVVGGRPFHAALLAGTLVGRSSDQVAAEQFLRIAEPPAHDRWTFNADLGERYARGSKKTLDELHARVTEELQRMLRPPTSRSGDGPEVLRKLLQIRGPRRDLPQHPQIRILRSASKIIEQAWHVEAEVSITPTSRVLHLAPRLSFRCEGGPAIPVLWAWVRSDNDAVEVVDNTLVLKPRTKRVTFTARSDPDSHPVKAGDSSAMLDVIARAASEL